MPVPCELRSTGPQDRCKSARGPDADLRRNILIYFISEGSRFGADSHAVAATVVTATAKATEPHKIVRFIDPSLNFSRSGNRSAY